jgi:hypothetical protein
MKNTRISINEIHNRINESNLNGFLQAFAATDQRHSFEMDFVQSDQAAEAFARYFQKEFREIERRHNLSWSNLPKAVKESIYDDTTPLFPDEDGAGFDEWQVYGYAADGESIFAGVYRLHRISRQTARKIQKRWLRNRAEYWAANPDFAKKEKANFKKPVQFLIHKVGRPASSGRWFQV